MRTKARPPGTPGRGSSRRWIAGGTPRAVVKWPTQRLSSPDVRLAPDPRSPGLEKEKRMTEKKKKTPALEVRPVSKVELSSQELFFGAMLRRWADKRRSRHAVEKDVVGGGCG